MAICDPHPECDTPLTWEQLVRLLAALSADGCPALRVVFFLNEETFIELRDDGGFELRDDDGLELLDEA